MKTVIGTKVIKSSAMSLAEYNIHRGWTQPEGEKDERGYLVEYEDGLGWTPEAQYLATYQDTDRMTFDHALYMIKQGYRVARAGWNGKDMFIFLVDGSMFEVNRPPLLGIFPEGTAIRYQPHIDMKTADESIVPWLCSQSDILANDWMLVEEPVMIDLDSIETQTLGIAV